MKYPHLFEPFRIGSTVYRNHIFASPTGITAYSHDGGFSDAGIAYYERKAMGGAAAVCIGECQIDPAHGGRPGATVDLGKMNTVSAMSRLAAAINGHGAAASVELQHYGMYGANMGAKDGGWGPSALDVHGKMSKEMSEEQILATIKAYATAAANCKMAGFKMVTIHGAHGWLPEQFFSRWTNKRTDRWGGSLENRTRFAVAVCDAIHERCGRDFPVEFRISATEFEEGYDPEEGIGYAMALDGHADIIHVSVGIHGDGMGPTFTTSYPNMFEIEGKNVHYAAEIKKHITQSRVAAVGSMTTPAYMEEVIASGQADIVCLARGLICDPDLPNKARSGREDEIRTCLRCVSCFSSLWPSGQIHCALNPETGYEQDAQKAVQVQKQKVLVAGGGVTGMQAALTAAAMGHDVTLAEKTDKLGGAITCEEAVPFKKNLHKYLDQQRASLGKAGVKVLLNTEVTPAFVEAGNYDAVLAAIGSAAVKPKIEGIDGPTVLDAESAYLHPEKCGDKVVILGAGLVGSELAIYLTGLGKQAEILELAERMPYGGMHSRNVATQLKNASVAIHMKTAAKKITDQGVEAEDGTFYPADTVVYATGRKPLFEEAAALGVNKGTFNIIGDCDKVANILTANRAAWVIARDIGR